MQKAYIVAGFRTAVGKANRGGFKTVSPVTLGATVINHLIQSIPNLEVSSVDDLIVGNAVPEAEQGLQMARWIAVKSNLPLEIPAVTVNRYCGSGLETIAMATAKIRAGYADVIIAGGAESMSLVPTVGYKTVPDYEIAKEHGDYFLGMGLTAEEVASKYKISREDMDQFSLSSHQKANKAIEEGKFQDEIVPVEVEEAFFTEGRKQNRSFTVSQDEGPRKDTSFEALSRLRPVFKQGGAVTAGNSSQTSDGASFVMVMSESKIKELGIEPLAELKSCVSVGVNPRYMGIGPIEAIPKALKRTGLKLNDINVIELNEAFAAQSLAVIREAGLNPDIVNVNGGAIALGHPLGCTGAKLSVQTFNELKRRKQKYGLITACIGGGQGIAGIYEMMH
jgi:acetyl-CoA acyltransferase